MGHIGSKGRALVAAALDLALRKLKSWHYQHCHQILPFYKQRSIVFAANYPEFLEKCIMINTPWVFNTFWYFVKGFLDEM